MRRNSRLKEEAAETGWQTASTAEARSTSDPFIRAIQADARDLKQLADHSADCVVTSPPYWKKRDYKLANQIGQESSPEEYVENLVTALQEWRRVLRPTGSVFLNIGDTYWKRCLVGIPGMVEMSAQRSGWSLRNRIIWAKTGGIPDPAKNRLAPRYEFILHFVLDAARYYYDLYGYAKRYGNGTNPGDVWQIGLDREMGGHLAPFPDELVERALVAACPKWVCDHCGRPRERIVKRTRKLDPERPQAVRAMEIAREGGLTDEHIAAIQATGISDAGKALRIQTGTGKNSKQVQRLAKEAKSILGGYFREFTFAKKITAGWTVCGCGTTFSPGVVLDPFMGTGTTLSVARRLGRSAVGVDLAPVVPIRSRVD